ncbi:MAG: hypothetical protein AAGM22_21690 [Acidobacteriota bacterium]
MNFLTAHRKPRLSARLAAIALAGIFAGGAQAQFTDEVWVQPVSYSFNPEAECTPGPGRCCFLETNHFNEDLFSDFTTQANWQTTFDRTTVLSLLLGTFANCNLNGDGDADDPGESWLTSTELSDLADFLAGDRDNDGIPDEHPIEMAITVGGVNLIAADYCDPAPDPRPGQRTAEGDARLFQRWVDAGGEIDHIFFDFPFKKIFTNAGYADDCGAGTPAADIWTFSAIAEEIRTYMDTLETELGYSLLNTKIHLWDGAIGYDLGLGATLPPWGQGVDFATLLDDTITALTREETVGGVVRSYDFVSFLTDADPQYVQNQGTPSSWEFERVLKAEEIARSKDLRIGVTNHLGPCAFGSFDTDDPADGVGDEFVKFCNMGPPTVAGGPEVSWSDAQFNDWSRDTFIRYARDYVDAGANPDFFLMGVWHRYPNAFGAEDAIPPVSQAAISRDILLDIYPQVSTPDYVDHDFATTADEDQWLDQESCFSIVSGKLTDSSDTNGLGNLCLATLQTSDPASSDVMADFDMSFELNQTSVVGAGWSGVLFRQTSATSPPWASGYLVRLDGTGTSREVVLSRTGTELDSAPLPGTGAVTLRVDARDNRLRVYADGSSEFLLNVLDDTYTSGTVSLATANASATYDDIDIDRVEHLIHGDDFESYGSSLDSPWVEVSALSVAGSTDQFVSADGGFGRATLEEETFSDLRMKATISIERPLFTSPSGANWGGFHVRMADDDDQVWNSGYAIQIKKDSLGQDTVELYCNPCTADPGISSPVLATANLGVALSGATTYDVELVTSGDRIQIFVDGVDEIDETVTATGRPTSGFAGLTAASNGYPVSIDDVEIWKAR